MKVRVTLDWKMEISDDENLSLEDRVRRYMLHYVNQPMGKLLPEMIVTDVQRVEPWEE